MDKHTWCFCHWYVYVSSTNVSFLFKFLLSLWRILISLISFNNFNTLISIFILLTVDTFVVVWFLWWNSFVCLELKVWFTLGNSRLLFIPFCIILKLKHRILKLFLWSNRHHCITLYIRIINCISTLLVYDILWYVLIYLLNPWYSLFHICFFLFIITL